MTVERSVYTCVCGSESRELAGEMDWFGHRQVLRCNLCRTLRVSPQPSRRQLEEFFSEQYFSDPSDWADRREPIFRHTTGVLERHGVDSVLDVGTAYGHLLAYLEDRGFDARGVDISDRAVRWGREHLDVEVRAGDIESVDGTYDALVMLDTLYYARQPIRVLMQARERCRDLLVLRLRNPESPLTDGLPKPHLWGFTKAGAAQVLKRAGFRPYRTSAAPPSRHWSRPVRDWLRRLNNRLTQLGAGLWTASYTVSALPGASGAVGEKQSKTSEMRKEQGAPGRFPDMLVVSPA